MASTFDLGSAVVSTEVDLGGLDKGLSQAESQTKSRFSSIGSTIGGTFKVAGAAAVAGMVTAGAAVAGFGALGLREFSGFQQGMNEVFTLMPGISQKSMGQMTDQVKSFATEFGVLPKEIVPALYQSLSAGVPPDNVFQFLETAQKAAAGGVTDLTTAVDGISGVINSYGADVIDAGKASDLMFTAVRLGKTTFGELSSSLYNVLPTAASLGVGFDQITAAMATMTSQNIPTAQATTQLRQLFVELSKEGGKANKTFSDIAGIGFREFVAQGGTVQEALQLMEQHAKDNGTAINDLFGSVEAGGAALALTGANTQKFSSDLAAMSESAGATDTAYQQMAQGLGFAFDKIKAAISVLLIDVGERLAPAFQQLADWIVANMPAISAVVLSVFDAIANGITLALPYLLQFGSFIASTILPALQQFGSFVLSTVVPALQQLGAFVLSTVLPGLQQFGSFLAATILPALQQLGQAVLSSIGQFQPAISAAIGSFQAWQPVIGAVLVVLGALISFLAGVVPGVFFAVAGVITGFFTIFQGLGNIVVGVVKIIAAVLTGNWTAAWNAAGQVVRGLVQVVTGLVGGLVTGVIGLIGGLVTGVIRFFQNLYHTIVGGSIIPDLVNGVIRWFTQLVSRVISFVSNFVSRVISFFSDLASRVVSTVSTFVSRVVSFYSNLVSGVISTVSNFVSRVISFFSDLGRRVISTVSNFVSQVISFYSNLASSAIGYFNNLRSQAVAAIIGLKDSVINAVSNLADTVRSRLSGVVDFARNLGSAFYNAGSAMIDGLKNGIMNAFGRARDAVAGGLQSLRNLLPFSEPKDRSSPLFGISKAGEELVHQMQIGIDRASLTIPPLNMAATIRPLGAGVAAGQSIVGQLPGGANTVNNYYQYQLEANYKHQEERELKDDVRLLSMLHGGGK